MSGFDDWDAVGLVFALLLVALFLIVWLHAWLRDNHPFSHSFRNSHGRKRMATDWRRPAYLPEDWQ